MNMAEKELFLNVILKEEDLQYCYISDDGKMFPPHYNTDGMIDVIGEDVYKNYLNNKNNPSKKEPTKEEVLLKEIANLKVDNMKKDVVVTSTLKSLAELKVEMMELKGGNK
ncbi:hypothetical protein FDE76_01475 [Clostridium botulinum]|uniref:RNA polymerase sigma factor n=1 Tax=Clostridium botulinum (strain Eklund 17B / Type B) TaxID=935198 RepID=B2TMH1_CLOBB|nr:putative RNA polymerase sigma factor [Clostridium botulinum B str. Eklund 17B (NRP)]MBY6975207.1 hypothetical protein [Clostridium botulinum]MBY7000188.1 hypothetical protein [Clostridium botulinum]MCR1274963.1 hypothetical protein [Clostridium botulinum]NFD68759.1 hypothetical protein [Clostridium botulinum]